jgi:hypothetical protein
MVEELATNPAVACEVCRVAADCVYRAPGARNDWEPLTERIVAVGEKAMERSPGDASAVRARAEATLCRLRLGCALERATKTEDWVAAADLFLKCEEIQPDEKLVERAVLLLREGAEAIGADPAALHERADKLTAEGAERYPTSSVFRRMLQERRLARIEELLVSDRRAAQKALEEYLAELRTKAQGSDPDIAAATAYTDGVTLVRATKGLGMKADYLTRSLTVAGGALSVEMPVSERWKYEDGAIEQWDRRGEHIRSFTFDTYSWDMNYYIGQKEFDGANLKGLAALGELNAEKAIVKIAKRKKPQRRRLNGHFPSAVYFEVSGIDEDGDFLTWAGYYVKGDKQRSLKITIFEHKDMKGLDPEAEAVIDSFREAR